MNHEERKRFAQHVVEAKLRGIEIMALLKGRNCPPDKHTILGLMFIAAVIVRYNQLPTNKEQFLAGCSVMWDAYRHEEWGFMGLGDA